MLPLGGATVSSQRHSVGGTHAGFAPAGASLGVDEKGENPILGAAPRGHEIGPTSYVETFTHFVMTVRGEVSKPRCS